MLPLVSFARQTGEYIVWPDLSRHAFVLSQFNDLRQHPFPNTFAAVDGCLISLKCPTFDSNSYYNRKGYH